jgi:hypothetical protein
LADGIFARVQIWSGHQIMLTPRIRELLCKADIAGGMVNDVPLDTISELVGLGIVDEQWRQSGSVRMGRRAATEEPATYVDRVKLTSAGIGLACSIQGVAQVVSSRRQNEITTGHGLGPRREKK